MPTSEGVEFTIVCQRTLANARVRLLSLVGVVAVMGFPGLQTVAGPVGALVAVTLLHHGDGRQAAAVAAHGTSSLVLCFDGRPVLRLPARRSARESVDGGMGWHVSIRNRLIRIFSPAMLCLCILVLVRSLLRTPDFREDRHCWSSW